MSSLSTQYEIRRKLALAAMGAGTKPNVVGGQSTTGLPPAIDSTLPTGKPMYSNTLDFANAMGANMRRPAGGSPALPSMGAAVMDQVRSTPDTLNPQQVRQAASAGQPTVDDKFSKNADGTAVQAAPVPTAAPGTLDPRIELRRLTRERRMADQAGADPATLAKYHAAQNELRQILAMQHRLRSLAARGEVTPEVAEARIAALEAQVPRARQMAAESAGAASERALANRDRFPNPVTARRADEASRGFADAVGRIDDPVDFTVQPRSTADPTQINIELRRMAANPSDNLKKLRERDYKTPEQVQAERLRLAQQEAQIRQAEAIEPSTEPDAIPMTPEQQARERALRAQQVDASLGSAETDAATATVAADPLLASRAAALVAGARAVILDERDAIDVDSIRGALARIKEMPPETQRLAATAIANAMIQDGISIDSLLEPTEPKGNFWLNAQHPRMEARRQEISILKLDLYRFLSGMPY